MGGGVGVRNSRILPVSGLTAGVGVLAVSTRLTGFALCITGFLRGIAWRIPVSVSGMEASCGGIASAEVLAVANRPVARAGGLCAGGVIFS